MKIKIMKKVKNIDIFCKLKNKNEQLKLECNIKNKPYQELTYVENKIKKNKYIKILSKKLIRKGWKPN